MTTADFPLYRYKGKVVSVHDGDTFTCTVDLGLEVYRQVKVRVVGFDAPELTGPRADPPAARAAKQALEQILTGERLYLETLKDSQSFARWLARVHVAGPEGLLIDVADRMIGLGHGRPMGPHGEVSATSEIG